MLCFTLNSFRVNRGLSLIEFALVPSVTLGIVGQYSFFFDSITRTFICISLRGREMENKILI